MRRIRFTYLQTRDDENAVPGRTLAGLDAVWNARMHDIDQPPDKFQPLLAIECQDGGVRITSS